MRGGGKRVSDRRKWPWEVSGWLVVGGGGWELKDPGDR